MGWGSAVHIFDAVVKEAKETLQEIQDQYSDHFSKREMLVRIAKPLAEKLDDGDWDTHRDSDYWDELKWDLWPEEAQEEKEEMEEWDEE